jgi:ATP-dependent Clp protease ATP-binding subunit ClpC
MLRPSRVLLAPRIMSSDRVPGIKMVTGTQTVSPPLSNAAARGAAALEKAVMQQQAAKRAGREDARALAAQRASVAQAGAPGRAPDGGSRLAQLLGVLSSRIDGQPLAKDVVARALRRRSLQLDDAERPLRLLFAGPSGVGKTAMASSVCEALMGSCVDGRNFKRFNLSEFSHPSKFNRLTGGDPNYVGYKEGGELTNFIRQAEDRRSKRLLGAAHTSCVLLLDEVDRAADGLLTFLMNFLDQGMLTDGMGETVDARRAVVLMTTNCGRDAIAATEGVDALEAAAAAARARAAIVARVRDDVLRDICDGRYENLGRLGTIVPFLPLRGAGRRAVATRQLDEVAARLVSADSRARLAGWSDAALELVRRSWHYICGCASAEACGRLRRALR